MPDQWEKSHGLDPAVPDHNADFDSDGYTNVEEYINEIAAWPAPQPIGFNGAMNNRYALLANWDIGWQPSQYDEVKVSSGTAVVDAPGQHAGTLAIAANAGDTAQLDVNGGWLRASSTVTIGGTSDANGTLNLNGGMLVAPVLSKGVGGQFNFVGGTLQAALIDFDLISRGGTLAVGDAANNTTINGNLEMTSGTLQIEIASADSYGAVTTTGRVVLAGDLRVHLGENFVPTTSDTFAIVVGQTVTGTFANVDSVGRVQVDGGTGSFQVAISANQVTLRNFVHSAQLPGDYHVDGVVDAADYVVWRTSLGTSGPDLAADGNGDKLVNNDDYIVWRAHFGHTADSDFLAGANLPEPRTAATVLLLLLAFLGRRCWFV
jgi:hypothetical protein